MQKIDLETKLKADAKNAVEEYCYNMRDKLSESLAEFVTQEVRISKEAQNMMRFKFQY